jgi:hypothetical protein
VGAERLAMFLPWLLNAVLVAWLARSVPWWDEWDVVDWWLRARAGGVDPAALWAPHNEHRIVLPRLLFYLALESGAGLVPLMLLSQLLFGATLGLLAPLLRQASAGWPLPRRLVTLTAFAAFALSWVQWLNMLMALQLSWSVALFGIVLALSGMADVTSRWAPWRLGAGVAIAYLSCAIWLVLVPLLLGWQGLRAWRGRHPAAAGRKELIGLAGMSAGLGVLLGFYLRGLRHATGPVPGTELGAVGTFLVRFYGGPFTARASEPWMSIGLATGIVFVVGSLALAVAAWRRARRGRPLPVLAIAAVALAHVAAPLIVLGRSSGGDEAALAGRYTSVTLLGWVGLLAAAMVMGSGQGPGSGAGAGSLPRRALTVGVLTLLTLGVLLSGAMLQHVARVRQPRLAAAEACLREVVADAALLASRRRCLEDLYPDSQRLVAIARRMAVAAR